MIYFISGLGADQRVFQFLQLDDFRQQHIQWLVPNSGESLENYVKRLKNQINEEEKFILVGLSFGGMVAIELAKILQPQKVVIISSVKHYQELPFYYRGIGWTKVHKLVPAFCFKSRNKLNYYLLGAKKNSTKKLLKGILEDTDEVFIKWAIHQILTWRNTTRIENLVHIHGTADKLLAARYIRDFIPIEAGEHLMIVDKAKEISKLLQENLI